MPAVRAVVKFPYITNLPRDVAVNTFHIWSDTIDAADLVVGWLDRITEFYNTATDSGVALGARFGGAIVRNLCQIEWYEIPAVDGPVGEPIAIEPWTLVAATGGTWPLPMEVAVCLSYAGTVSSEPDVPAPSRRGRIYLGPLNSGAIDTAADSIPNPNSNFMNCMTDAGTRLAEYSTALDGYWSVFSRTRWAFTPILGGFVDEEFDTQRRREMDATARRFWTV